MTTVRGDVEQVKNNDRDFPDPQAVMHARMAAVIDAQQRVARRELGARYELRQALVDLAAITELIAEELPRPAVTLARR